MEYHIDINAKKEDIVELIEGAVNGDTVCCQLESQFEDCKRALIQTRRAGITLCLLDQDGYAIRQTSSKKRAQIKGARFNDRQLAVIRALEKVLEHCRKEDIALIGYSDELVALPASLVGSNLASAHAREVYAAGVYRGADGIDSIIGQ